MKSIQLKEMSPEQLSVALKDAYSSVLQAAGDASRPAPDYSQIVKDAYALLHGGQPVKLERLRTEAAADLDPCAVAVVTVVIDACSIAFQLAGLSGAVSRAVAAELASELSPAALAGIRVLVRDLSTASSLYEKAKAVFAVISQTYSALGITGIIKALKDNMSWYDYILVGTVVVAQLTIWFATDGAALIAEIAMSAALVGIFVADVLKIEGACAVEHKSLSFNGNKDGSGSYISVPHAALLCPSTALTLEAQVRWNGVQGYIGCVSKPNLDNGSVQTGYTLALNNGSPMLGIITQSGENRSAPGGVPPLTRDQWSGVSITYDGQQTILYINGNEAARQSWPASGPIATGTTSLLIGREFLNGLADRAFAGFLADVRIWNRTLTPAVISQWITNPNLDGHPDRDALVGQWRLDEGSGTTANDASGHGFQGQLANGAQWQPAP